MMDMAGNIIRLRPIRLEDAGVLCSWKNCEETYQYLGGGYQPISCDQYKRWVENMIDLTGNNRRFMVEYESNQAIGMIGLYDINWIHRTCEIGLLIGNQCARGKGAGSEACRILEAYARNYLNLRKIKLKVVDENERAVFFWSKLGYCEAGRLMQERYINGKYCDVVIMEKFL